MIIFLKMNGLKFIKTTIINMVVIFDKLTFLDYDD